MAIHLFADKIRRGQEITMFDGSSIRDYTFVDDIVLGVVAAIDNPIGFEIINLSRCSQFASIRLIEDSAAVGKESSNAFPTNGACANTFAGF